MVDFKLCYCKTCGRIVLFLFDKDKKICDYCKNNVFPIPEEFLSSAVSLKEDLKEQFIDEYIKSSPEFDQNLFNDREEYKKQHSGDFEKYNAALEHGKEILEEKSRGPKCPSCGSSNISKIGVVNRAVSVGIFGLASSKIGKTHKCNNCGTTW